MARHAQVHGQTGRNPVRAMWRLTVLGCSLGGRRLTRRLLCGSGNNDYGAMSSFYLFTNVLGIYPEVRAARQSLQPADSTHDTPVSCRRALAASSSPPRSSAR